MGDSFDYEAAWLEMSNEVSSQKNNDDLNTAYRFGFGGERARKYHLERTAAVRALCKRFDEIALKYTTKARNEDRMREIVREELVKAR